MVDEQLAEPVTPPAPLHRYDPVKRLVDSFDGVCPENIDSELWSILCKQASFGVTPAEPPGCVLDWDWLKAFDGPKGQAVCYQQGNDRAMWTVRSDDGGYSNCYQKAEAIAKCRELAGLEPDEPPEAYYEHRKATGLDSHPSLVKKLWNNPLSDVLWKKGWRAAKQEGGDDDE